MTKTFEFETSDGAMLEVSIDIECRDPDGCDASFNIEAMHSLKTDQAVRSSDLSESDQMRLERRCQDCADSNALYAWQEYAEAQADRAYDEMRDRESGL